jgi:hypothetical protein
MLEETGSRLLQPITDCYRRMAGRIIALCLLTVLATATQAQESATGTAQSIPDDYYRAEFVILERIVDPADIDEKMSGREVTPPEQSDQVLWAVDQDGTPETTLDLVKDSDLYLNTAAQRLERSGKYRVLMKAGWYEAFPPGYEGEPLKVSIGNWLDGARQREIQGTITIDRKRYLHVKVNLNQWQLAPEAPMEEQPDMTAAQTDQPGTAPSVEEADQASGTPATAQTPMPETMMAPTPVQLLTWIHETRRMRSEEIHFLDSPTIGVLVFFKKVEAKD